MASTLTEVLVPLAASQKHSKEAEQTGSDEVARIAQSGLPRGRAWSRGAAFSVESCLMYGVYSLLDLQPYTPYIKSGAAIPEG